jgi:hypothetical protein
MSRSFFVDRGHRADPRGALIRDAPDLHHGVLHALLLGQPDQAMGVEGVGRPPDPVEGEGDSFRGPDRLHLGIEARRPLPASELGGAILLPVHTFIGHVWYRPLRRVTCSRRRSEQVTRESQIPSQHGLAPLTE